MKFCTAIHDPQKTNPTDFGDPPMYNHKVDFSGSDCYKITLTQ